MLGQVQKKVDHFLTNASHTTLSYYPSSLHPKTGDICVTRPPRGLVFQISPKVDNLIRDALVMVRVALVVGAVGLGDAEFADAAIWISCEKFMAVNLLQRSSSNPESLNTEITSFCEQKHRYICSVDDIPIRSGRVLMF